MTQPSRNPGNDRRFPHPAGKLLTVKTRHGRVNFFHFHSLSLVALAILGLWILLYIGSDPGRHAGAFYGNAIADWSGSVIIIIATKYFFEVGSEESRRVPRRFHSFLRKHSLSIFLVITGLGWLVLYQRMDAMSKWGQVVGNLVSEWLQMLGLVLLTKRFLERGSKESRQA